MTIETVSQPPSSSLSLALPLCNMHFCISHSPLPYLAFRFHLSSLCIFASLHRNSIQFPVAIVIVSLIIKYPIINHIYSFSSVRKFLLSTTSNQMKRPSIIHSFVRPFDAISISIHSKALSCQCLSFQESLNFLTNHSNCCNPFFIIRKLNLMPNKKSAHLLYWFFFLTFSIATDYFSLTNNPLQILTFCGHSFSFPCRVFGFWLTDHCSSSSSLTPSFLSSTFNVLPSYFRFQQD